jgi:hypothetical protein
MATLTQAVQVKNMPETVHEVGYLYPRGAFLLVDGDTEDNNIDEDNIEDVQQPVSVSPEPVEPVAARTRGRL